jgi:hypothetical protein
MTRRVAALASEGTNHGLKWLQDFLGQNSKFTDDYGVVSIPQIMLVGMDGELIAVNPSGPGIKTAVAQALERRQ